jgi:hypothetical protein
MEKPATGDHEQALAYLISMEKVYGSPEEETLIIKVTSLQKRDSD